jgi:hypothetical protein
MIHSNKLRNANHNYHINYLFAAPVVSKETLRGCPSSKEMKEQLAQANTQMQQLATYLEKQIAAAKEFSIDEMPDGNR